MLDRRIQFIQDEVSRVNPYQRQVTFAHGDVVGKNAVRLSCAGVGSAAGDRESYGLLRECTICWISTARSGLVRPPRVSRRSGGGRSLSGRSTTCSRFETAFALSRLLEERDERDRCTITIVSDKTWMSYLVE
jgi:hypothetical protein